MNKTIIVICLIALLSVVTAQQVVVKCCLNQSTSTISARMGSCSRRLQRPVQKPTKVPAYCPRRVGRRLQRVVNINCTGRRLLSPLRQNQRVVYKCPTSSYGYRCFENTQRLPC